MTRADGRFSVRIPGGASRRFRFAYTQPRRGWRTVKTTRTLKRGTFSTRYRFSSAHGRFRFRVRLRPNDSYPYARGNSAAVRVRVG
jgi:hypothetical protein